MPHQHSSLDKQVNRRNLLETLKSLSREDLHELCVVLIKEPADRPHTATDIRTIAVKLIEWAEALSGCGLHALAKEVELLTGKSCTQVHVDIIQELRYLDFQDQINESRQHLSIPNPKAFIIHSPRESVYCWLLKRFFIPFENQSGDEESPKIYRFPMASLSSSIFDEIGLWENLYRQLGHTDSFCPERIPQILHRIEVALYSSKVFFIIDGIETTDEKFVIAFVEKFWFQIVDRLIQIRHTKKEHLFLFLVDSSDGCCHGFFPPGQPSAKREWTMREFVSLSRTQAIFKKDFTFWLGCNPNLSDSPEAINDMADSIYGGTTYREIDEIAEVLAKFVPAQRDKILGMLKL